MIFGIQNSKIKSLSGTEIDLKYDILEPSWIEPNIITNQSIVNAHREWKKIADPHASFSVVVNLHKYPIPDSKFIEIYNYLNTLVYFYPHKDGGAINDTSGVPVKFYFADMQMFCLEEPYYDACRLTFISQDGIDFSQSLTGFLENKSGDLLMDKDGDNLIIKPGHQFVEEEKQSVGDPGTSSEEI